MGNICCRKKRARRKIVLLLVGLDNAGKTKSLNRLAGDCSSSPVPTVGFSVIQLRYLDYDVKIFDLGGGPNIRAIWNKYFVDAYGLIFVLDSSDFSRFNEAKTVLEDMLSSEKTAGKPLLVLANKQDHENALDEIDVIEYLNIEQLVNRHKCPTLVQSCSASETSSTKLDPGIQKGYDWLLSIITRNYDVLNERVERDVVEQDKKYREEMLERIERIKNVQVMEDKKNVDAIETYSDYVKKINDKSCEQLKRDEIIVFDKLQPPSSSSSSSLSFPPVYVASDYALPERPKSAVQMVKHQLQLNSTTKKPVLKSRSNKTTPMNLYNVKLCQSAKERRKVYSLEGRNLKSADDRVYTISNNVLDHVGSGGDYYNVQDIQMNNISRSISKSNGVPWMNGDMTLNVVDLD